MIKQYLPALALALSFLLICSCERNCISVDEEDLGRIGELIYMNEASGKEDNLTVWNDGEQFASLGIGHFLWYPAGREYRFRETFPDVYGFMKSKGASPPEWMERLSGFDLPWDSREAFYSEFESPRMRSLREFLHRTVSLQTLYMFGRLESSLGEMLAEADDNSKSDIRKQFYRVANSPMGMYVLIDYVNFKGEGTSESERYNGEGWGLLQVLERMDGSATGPEAIKEFSDSAVFVLERRVENSPPDRNEKRWLPGWRNRIKTYTEAQNIMASSGEAGSGRTDSLAALYRRIVCGI